MTRRVCIAAAAVILASLALRGSGLTSGAAGSDVQKTQVCFVVHNPGGPIAPGLNAPPDTTPQAIIADQANGIPAPGTCGPAQEERPR